MTYDGPSQAKGIEQEMISKRKIKSKLISVIRRTGMVQPPAIREFDVPTLNIGTARLPAVGFGTSGLLGRDCSVMVETALALGYRHIDTAQAYGNEAAVGHGLSRSAIARDEIFLSTKLEIAQLSAEAVEPAVRQSLARLATDYVDMLMIHWPSKEVPIGETLATFESLRAAGMIRHIGVCNFTTRLLQEAAEVQGANIICNQVEYHPLLAQRQLLQYQQDKGIALVAYSPLGRGRIIDNPVLQRIGRNHGKSAAQVALAWLVSQKLVAVIPKASSEAHCRANLEIFDIQLSSEEMAEISALDSGERIIDPTWAPKWD